MDTSIYVAIALAIAVVLFFAFGRKQPPPAPTPSEEKAPGHRTSQVDASTENRKETDGVPAPEPTPAAGSEEVSGNEQIAGNDQQPPPRPSSGSIPPSPKPPKKTPEPPPVSETRRDITGLRQGLALSRNKEGFFGRIRALFGKGEISPEIVEQLEQVLLTSDVGVATSSAILERIRGALSKGELKDEGAVWEALRSEARQLLSTTAPGGGLKLRDRKPTVVLMVGVNGAGKTTTIGKLATQLKSQGLTCVLAAGDTFRAAAVQQLVVWGNRVGCEVVRGKDGSDPGSVIFDAIKKAQDIGADVVLADTAGRLHTKSNLMAEMQKIARTTGKALEGAPHEMLLVIDSTNGQNALAQAKEFKDSLPLSGIVLTKLDGTAKGGVVLGIADSLKIPVRYVGLGERPDDLHEFVIDDFVEALLGKETN